MTQYDSAYLTDRLTALRQANAPYNNDRWRIRQIMNGGPEGIKAVMAWDQGKATSGRSKLELGYDLPAVNMMASGVERLAQSVSAPPMLKMPYGPRDSAPSREAAELRERIVEGWDDESRVRMWHPQIGRWLPGYAFSSAVIRPRRSPVSRQVWPHAELRDPYDTWPGYFGAVQSPHEIAYRRSVPLPALMTVFPEYPWDDIFTRKRGQGWRQSQGRIVTAGEGNTETWEGNNGGTQVFEYYCDDGCYVCVPEFEMVVSYDPNLCDTGPMFVFGKRFAFDRLISAYAHVIGLVAMMAKFNVLALIQSEESAFSELNIFGELEGNTYQRGRKGVNRLDQNARVEKPKEGGAFNTFQQIDRLERQLRIGAAYDQGSDSIAARGGWITGQGQQELRDPIDKNIDEYQLIMRQMMEDLDTRRLEWEEKHERSRKKRVFWLEGSKQGEETYVPSKDIAGNWRSKREYGMMATWDDNSKIVAGLQLNQAGVIDLQTFRENLSGIDNAVQIEQRVLKDQTRSAMLSALGERAAANDPGAMLALVELNQKPDQLDRILTKFFTPQNPQPSPEEEAMMGGAPGAPGPEVPVGGPPTVQTVLSELEASGVTGGGVQTVAVNRRK